MTTPPAFNLEKLNATIDGKKPGRLTANEVHRARVPGGWLVLVGHHAGFHGVTFYPDPKHQWKGDTLPG